MSSGLSTIWASVVAVAGDCELERDSLMLCTPKLFSSVRKNVNPPPGPPATERVPGEDDREVTEAGWALGRVEDDGGGANMSSRGRIAGDL